MKVGVNFLFSPALSYSSLFHTQVQMHLVVSTTTDYPSLTVDSNQLHKHADDIWRLLLEVDHLNGSTYLIERIGEQVSPSYEPKGINLNVSCILTSKCE